MIREFYAFYCFRSLYFLFILLHRFLLLFFFCNVLVYVFCRDASVRYCCLEYNKSISLNCNLTNQQQIISPS